MSLPSFTATTAALAHRTWIKTFRRPVVLTFSFIQPLMWMLFFGFLFQHFRLEGFGANTRYLDFLAPGVSLMTVLFGASQSGIGWIRDLQTGFLPRMLGTPASRAALLFGKIAADVARLVAQAFVVLLVGMLVGARLAPSLVPVLYGTVAVALFATAFSCVSCAIALRARAQEAMATFVHLVNMPLLFTSTILVPDRQMPEWLAGISRLNPLTLAADAWRGAWLSGTMPSITTTLIPLALLTVVLFAVALWAMNRIGVERAG